MKKFPEFNAVVLGNTSGIGNAAARHVQALAAVTTVTASVITQPDIRSHANTYLHGSPFMTKFLVRKYGAEVLKKGYNIAYWVHESSEVRNEFREWLPYYNEVWTASEYCKEIFERSFGVPVAVVNHPITRFSYNSEVGDPFTFMTMYTGGSRVLRKGTHRSIEAFTKAFGQRTDVKLIVKHRELQPSVRKWLVDLAQGSNVVFDGEDYGQEGMDKIYKKVDCGLHLFAAEGFGLPALEMMGFGRPSVMTNYSGVLEYANHSNSYLCDYKIGECDDDYFHGEWAYPNMDHAVALCKQAVDDSGKKGINAFQTACDFNIIKTVTQTWNQLSKLS